MSVTRRIAPPNSLLFIADATGGEAPRPAKGARILSSPSCVSVGCLAFMDGETTVVLGDGHDVDPGEPPAFDGTVETPSRKLVVSTVENDVILQTLVSDHRTRVRIWTNRTNEPDHIIIGTG